VSGEAVHFLEVQRFRQWWIWALLAFVAGTSWFFFIEAVLFGEVEGGAELAITIAVWAFSGILLPLFFSALRLESEVRADGIYVRFFPLHLRSRRFAWDEIASVDAVDYRPILDYGGWGIRYGSKGKAYNVSGREGVRLSFKDGRRDLLIGSRHPVELVEAVRTARRKDRG
jgi:hypothetical protein